MECPICGEELNHHDSFGYFAGYGSGEKCGDIYKCFNEACEGYGDAYHTHCGKEDDLHEGMPC